LLSIELLLSGELMAVASDQVLMNLGISLPTPAASIANYVGATKSSQGLLFISGQLPMENGKPQITGLLGDNVTAEEGYRAARLCAINILAQAKAALDGDLGRIKKCLKLTGFVASTPSFDLHPKVINGASDLIVEVLGEAGRHSRSAVGVSCLPLGSSVEVEAIFEI
jgi:enamine deaminase RidA (YjgF/YER057c/UK114 family)